VGNTGLEPLVATTCHDKKLRQSELSGGTNSGTLGAQFGELSPDLVTVINAWPKLSEKERQRIVVITERIKKGGD
jgi:hypothetical protein